MNIREELFKLKDEKYKNFSSKLTKTKYPMIGVRIPSIKKLAKEIKKQDYFNNVKNPFFEEVMLEGLLISKLNNIEEVINKLRIFVNKIDDWSICDSVCASLKIVNKYKEDMWKFITSFKDSSEEFEVRFMLIMMLDYYLEEKYINRIFDIIDNLKCNKYYVKMAVAWLLATCFVKCEKETLLYIEDCKIDDFTFNKMISKCNDSFRISYELKQYLKKRK